MNHRHRAQFREARRVAGEGAVRAEPAIVGRLEERAPADAAPVPRSGERTEVRERQYVRLGQAHAGWHNCPQLKRLIRHPYREDISGPERAAVPSRGIEARTAASMPVRPPRPVYRTVELPQLPTMEAPPRPFARRREALREEAWWK